MLNSLEPDQLFDIFRSNSWSICLSSPSDYAATGSCRQYFASIGEANLGVLQRESSQRKQLLLEALICLVRGQGTALHKAGENLGLLAVSRNKNALLQWHPVLFNPSVSCIVSENSWHTSERGKCGSSRTSSLRPGWRIYQKFWW